MKGQLDRTKVVLRHLPPSISLATVMEQFDDAFADRYNWVVFRPGKSSQKYQLYSRVYIDFNKPADVVEFAEFFDGHIFVNERGAQFKTVVEYAPSQRVPKCWPKKDAREGALLKDPEYLEFLEFIAKPVENLPSAEVQLDKREAERAGAAKDGPIITPLMDFVRQKRATKSGSRRSLSNGKPSRRATRTSGGGSSSSKLGSEKKGISTTMYVLRDTAKTTSGKDKSTYVDPKRDDQQVFDKVASGMESSEVENVASGNSDTTKKKVLLLKGKERDSHVVISDPQNVISPAKSSHISTVPKQIQRREGSSRIIRSILLNRDARHCQSSSGIQSEQKIQPLESRRPPRSPNPQLILKNTNGTPEDRIIRNDKQEKRARNKDRPDRGVWAPLRRSDGSHASDESLSSSASQSAQPSLEFPEVGGEVKTPFGGRSSHSSMDNGSLKHVGRRVPVHIMKDTDGSNIEPKPSKKGGALSYGSHEKQVWVQKSSSGS